MPTKVLIVDDSRIFRGTLEQCLNSAADIQVIGSAWNGKKALEFIQQERPDIVTLDINMPEMDGLETLVAIQNINAETAELPPIGVIMVSSFTTKGADTTIKALEMGAFDFITKPKTTNISASLEILESQIITKIKNYTGGTLRRMSLSAPHTNKPSSQQETPFTAPHNFKALLIGVSTGGPKALNSLLPELCNLISLPILIVQHMPKTFTKSLAESLNRLCRHQVVEATHNDPVLELHTYIAPGGRHLLVRKQEGKVLTSLNDQEPDMGCRPSANVLFRSAIQAYGGNVLAMILTGMGSDGTKGAHSLKRAGAYIIAQDESSSVVWGMPKSAIDNDCVNEVIPLHKIAARVAALI